MTTFASSHSPARPTRKPAQPPRKSSQTVLDHLIAAANEADDPANCIDLTGLPWAEQRKSLLGE